MEKTIITVEVLVAAPVVKVWEYWTDPAHIIQWNNASDDWHTPRATNDLHVGGKFNYRMEAKDGSFGFDFEGTYTVVDLYQKIEYNIIDGREVKINFMQEGDLCKVVESFEAENQNSIELQRGGWQAIINNFKKHVEATP